MIFAVTGANGFLGVHIIHHLLIQGHEVKAICRSTSSFSEFDRIRINYDLDEKIYQKLQWKVCDLYDMVGLEEVFSSSDYVVHAAGVISYHKADKQKLIRINQQYTANVVNAALAVGVKKLLYCSSIAAISKNNNNDLVTEDSVWSSEFPHSYYGLSKHLGEFELWRAKEEGLDVVVVNPGIILGFGDWHKGSNQLFKNAYRQFIFYSSGVTGFVGVEDVAIMIEKLCLSSINGERFILVSENMSFKEVAQMMAEEFERRSPFIEVKGILYRLIYGLVSLKELMGVKGMLSRETVRSSVSKNQFSNTKVTQALDIKFSPISHVIKKSCKQYKKSLSYKKGF